MDDFIVEKLAGHGAQGVVFKARCKSSGDTVAIKKIDISTLSPVEREAALAEVSVLEALRDEPHECIMGYRTSFVDDTMLCLVLDWCQGGTLQELLDSRHFEPTASAVEVDIWVAAISIFAALEHCHARGILHRDVKLGNVFVDSSPGERLRVKLGDFGVSCILGDRSRARTMVGTPYYLSPELCCGEPYDAKSDVWATGVMLYQLCNSRLPYEASNYAALILRIVQQPAMKQTMRFDGALHSLASKCLAKNPKDRPTARSVLRSSAVQKVAMNLDMSIVPQHVLAQGTKDTVVDFAPSRSAGLPLRGPRVQGSVPSRRVRNKHQQSKLTVNTPKAVAGPLRVHATVARTVRPPSAVAERDKPRVSEASVPPRPLSQAARQRAARTVAALPTFGSSDSEPEVADFHGDGCSETNPIPPEAPREITEQTTFGVAVGWAVDGDSGVAGHTMDAISADVAGYDSADELILDDGVPAVQSLASTGFNRDEVLCHLHDLHDEAEAMIEPSMFALLLDTLKNDPPSFERLLSEPHFVNHADELTYLCFRFVLLEGELRRSE